MRAELRNEMLRVLEESSKGDSKGTILHMGDNSLTIEAVLLLEEYDALRKGTSQYTITISGYDYYQKLKTPRVYWAKKNWFPVAVLIMTSVVTVATSLMAALLD